MQKLTRQNLPPRDTPPPFVRPTCDLFQPNFAPFASDSYVSGIFENNHHTQSAQVQTRPTSATSSLLMLSPSPEYQSLCLHLEAKLDQATNRIEAKLDNIYKLLIATVVNQQQQTLAMAMNYLPAFGPLIQTPKQGSDETSPEPPVAHQNLRSTSNLIHHQGDADDIFGQSVLLAHHNSQNLPSSSSPESSILDATMRGMSSASHQNQQTDDANKYQEVHESLSANAFLRDGSGVISSPGGDLGAGALLSLLPALRNPSFQPRKSSSAVADLGCGNSSQSLSVQTPPPRACPDSPALSSPPFLAAGVSSSSLTLPRAPLGPGNCGHILRKEETPRTKGQGVRQRRCAGCLARLRASGQPNTFCWNRAKKTSYYCETCPNQPAYCPACFEQHNNSEDQEN